MMRPRLRLVWLVILFGFAPGCTRNAPPAPVELHNRSHVATVAPAPAASPAPMPPRATGAPEPEPTPVPAHSDHIIVGTGDTIYSVAERHGMPVRSLIEANGLTPPYRLAPGSSLTLPQPRQHTVRSGETVYSVSRLYGVDVSTLARTNHIEPPYTIRVGEALLLPAAVEPAQAAATPPPPVAPPPTPPKRLRAEPPPPAPTPAPPKLAAIEPAPMAAPPEPTPPPPAPAPVEPPKAAPAFPPLEPLATLARPPPISDKGFLWPVRGRIIAPYGEGAGGTHNDGINIAAPSGTAVLAADAGVVAYAGNELRGYGNLILLKHAGGWMTAYAHNASLLVKRGERVKRGQPIARLGSTGAVSEPQLHFEIRRGTRALDPVEYLPAATASR